MGFVSLVWVLDRQKLSEEEIQTLFDKCKKCVYEDTLKGEKVIIIYQNGLMDIEYWKEEDEKEIDKILIKGEIVVWNFYL